ncbi:MAG: hypothetical protein IT171_02700 [Acidobacteria bacterium]|nr:hypothetical protein [Pyrinomonadaceae bacterium]MCC6451768.1 hypothetical protein [Acidobacteriota bacterium]
MIHFIYLVLFAFFVSVAFGVFSTGTTKERVWYGGKTFLQFMVISLVLAWILYFIPPS